MEDAATPAPHQEDTFAKEANHGANQPMDSEDNWTTMGLKRTLYWLIMSTLRRIIPRCLQSPRQRSEWL